MEQIIIKYVAIYLRKSRGDDETALDKHKLVLTELCKEKNWKYVLYEEIMSGDSIEMRPIFTKLLQDIEGGIYDGVVVMDIDRLGRGNQSDQGRINDAFTMSNTYIITPQQIFNLNNDDDEFVVDMKSFISRREYKQIVKRLTQGKKIGSRQGNWTNGIPPYGYSYERYGEKYNPKGLVVNDEQYKIYRLIIDSMIEKQMTPKDIAIMLNGMNISAPRGQYWHANTINRLAVDQTHLGLIISNKTKGDGHANKKANAKPLEYIPKDNWVIVNNCHEAIKTQDEHEKILLFLARRTTAPKRTQNDVLPLSSLVKCGICGHTLGMYKRKDRKQHVLKPCWYVDPFGAKCGNKGMVIDVLQSYTYDAIDRYYESLLALASDVEINENKLIIEQKIISLKNEITNKQKSLDRILDAFESGVYNISQFKERKNKVELSIESLNNQIEILEIEYKQYDLKNLEKHIDSVKNVKEKIRSNSITDKQKNDLLKTIIDKIVWTRKTTDDIDIDIKFLKI